MRARHVARSAIRVEQTPAPASTSSGAGRRHIPVSKVRPLEKQVLSAVLAALRAHPAVAFAWRANTGSFEVEGRRVRAGFRGQSDILGMLCDGRFLALECKRIGERPTPDQEAFLDRVRVNGGVALVATSVDDVMAALLA
jgi:hypothetical protein